MGECRTHRLWPRTRRYGAEAGARRLGLPAPTTSTLDHTPTLPTRLPHIPDGKTGFEEWEAGEVGGSKKGP